MAVNLPAVYAETAAGRALPVPALKNKISKVGIGKPDPAFFISIDR
jgi:hypothetical protein